MSTGNELLNAIHAFPEEDTPRLVYAEWLDEQDAIYIDCPGCGGKGKKPVQVIDGTKPLSYREYQPTTCPQCKGNKIVRDMGNIDRAAFIRAECRIEDLRRSWQHATGSVRRPGIIKRMTPDMRAIKEEFDQVEEIRNSLFVSWYEKWISCPCQTCKGTGNSVTLKVSPDPIDPLSVARIVEESSDALDQYIAYTMIRNRCPMCFGSGNTFLRLRGRGNAGEPGMVNLNDLRGRGGPLTTYGVRDLTNPCNEIVARMENQFCVLPGSGGRALFSRRGFFDGVSCTMAEIGCSREKQCPKCKGASAVQSLTPPCETCEGVGSVEVFTPTLWAKAVLNAPKDRFLITRFIVQEQPGKAGWGGYYGWVRTSVPERGTRTSIYDPISREDILPNPVWDALEGYSNFQKEPRPHLLLWKWYASLEAARDALALALGKLVREGSTLGDV